MPKAQQNFATPPPMANGATTWRLAASPPVSLSASPPHAYGTVDAEDGEGSQAAASASASAAAAAAAASATSAAVAVGADPRWLATLKTTLLIIGGLLLVYLVAVGIHDDWLDLFLTWAEKHRYAASVSIVVLFIPVALMFVPVDVPLYLCAGFMYGFYRGSLLCWLGYNLGSWVGFYFGRWCFQDWLYETTKDQLYIQAIRAAIDDNSFVLVLLLQIAPIMPYSMVCYFFGASNCPFFPSYVVGTAIGVIPCVCFFVFMVSASLSCSRSLALALALALSLSAVQHKRLVGGLSQFEDTRI